MVTAKTLTLVLAGGVGSRLQPLTARRCKPAVPFGGNLRLIDFSLMNCWASGLRSIYLLAQYQARSLAEHCERRWSSLCRVQCSRTGPECEGGHRYLGTADAVHKNEALIRSQSPDVVLLLSGDHIYNADYQRLVESHLDTRADVTVLTSRVSTRDASRFGVLSPDARGRIRGFTEKPRDATSLSCRGRCYINLGVYCFRPEFLLHELSRDACDTSSSHDFGRDILPRCVGEGAAVVSCSLDDVSPSSYWRDVGTVDALFDANMDLVRTPPCFDLQDCAKGLRSIFGDWLPRVHECRWGNRVLGINMVAGDPRLRGAHVVRSVISPGVEIEQGAHVEQCVLLAGCRVKSGTYLRRAVVEEGVTVSWSTAAGTRNAAKSTSLTTPRGVTVLIVPNDRRRARQTCDQGVV